MTAIDYPDYQAYGNQQSSNLVSSYRKTLAAGVTAFTPIAITQYSAVRLIIHSIGSALNTTATFTTAKGSGYNVQTYKWYMHGQVSLDVIIPCATPYLTLSIDNVGGASGNTTIEIIGMNIPAPILRYPVPSTAIGKFNVLFAPGSVTKTYAPWIYKGQAHLNVSPADTSGSLDVSVISYSSDGSYEILLTDVYEPTNNVDRSLILPDQTVLVEVVNNDSQNSRVASWSLVAA